LWYNHNIGYLNERDFSYFKYNTSTGKLNLTFSADYCDDLTKDGEVSANVIVKECVAVRDETHPFSYPYNNYLFESYNFENDYGNFTGIVDDGVNPLSVTHSCCNGDPNLPGTWELKEKDAVCFVNPAPGCYGGIIGYTDRYSSPGTNNGYVFEQQLDYCDGIRGNVCGLEKNYTLWEDKLTCGNNSEEYVGCDNIEPKCQELPSFSLIKDEGWCYKEMGCEDLCTDSIVYTRTDNQNTFTTTEINTLAKDSGITSQVDQISPLFPFTCGCSDDTENMPCDNNYDGGFNKNCIHGECKLANS